MGFKELSPSDIERNHVLYSELTRLPDGWTPGLKHWAFRQLISIAGETNFPISGSSCFDVGCGSGDLYDFTLRRGAASYIGVDIYEPALRRARQKYPSGYFLESDFLTFLPDPDGYDYVFSSGTLTTGLESTDNLEFARAMIEKMWQVSRVGVAMNILTPSPRGPLGDYVYKYPLPQFLDLCREVAPDAEVVSSHEKDIYLAHVHLFRPR